MKKRVLSALLALCMACGLAGSALAETGTELTLPAAAPAASTVEVTPAPSAEPAATETPSPSEEPAPSETPEPIEQSAAAEAPVPSATPAATEEPVSSETPAVEVTEDRAEAADGSTVYTAALTADGETMNVTVTAPAGAFAAGAQPQLQVSLLTDAAQQDAVAAELDNADVDYDGFTALDITFTDAATGAEIEPAQQVDVRIELPGSIVDSGIDLATLAVRHLEENAAGTVEQVVEVATLGNGITLSDTAVAAVNAAAGVAAMNELPAEEAPAAVAEFQVDGFSYFTITWTNYQQAEVSKELTVTLVDEEGNVLPGDHLAKFDISTSSSVSLNDNSSRIPYVQNYEYIRAVIASDAASAAQGTAISQVRLHGEWTWEGWNPVYAYSWQYQTGNKWTNFDEQAQHIYLIYSKDVTGGSGSGGGDVEVDLPTPAISKTAIRNGDGETYSLNLSVTGGVGSQTETTNVDVLLVVDESNSMTDARIRNTKTAIKSLIDSLESQERVDARYSILTFGRDARDEMTGWQSMPETYTPNFNASYSDRTFRNTIVGGAVNKIANSGEGTNYEAALDLAADRISTARDDAITVVVFLSDGSPSMSSNWGDGTTVMSSNGFWAWRETMETADNIYCDQFYSIGISADMEQFMGDSTEGYGGLINTVNAQTKVYKDTDDQGNDLSDIFKGIGGDVTNLYIKNIAIHDTLDLVNVEQVPGTSIGVTVTDPDGNLVPLETVGLTEGMIQTAYSDAEGLTFRIPDYELQPGYTYTVTMQIQPTEWAKTEYADQNYPNTATQDWYTGTHTYTTGDKGIYSNISATLTYEYTENEEGTEAEPLTYPMPVIQVPEIKTGDLKITKAVTGDEGVDAELVKNQIFTFTVTAGEGVDPEALNGKTFKIINGTSAEATFTDGTATVSVKGTGTVTIQDLPLGTYTISETGPADLADYYYDGCSFTDNSNTVTIEAEKDGAITVTNTYKAYRTITVKKVVDGNMGEKDYAFSFTAMKAGTSIAQADITAVENTPAEVKGAGTFTLEDTGSVTISKVKQDEAVTITEETASGYVTTYQIGTDEVATGDTATVAPGTSDVTVTFTNTRNMEVPTGLSDTSKPLALLALIALVGGAALAGSVVVRRRRRQE